MYTDLIRTLKRNPRNITRQEEISDPAYASNDLSQPLQTMHIGKSSKTLQNPLLPEEAIVISSDSEDLSDDGQNVEQRLFSVHSKGIEVRKN